MRSPRPLMLSLLALPLLLVSPTVGAAQLRSIDGTESQPSTPLAARGASTFEAAQRARRNARHLERSALSPVGDQVLRAPAPMADGFEASGFAQFMSSPAGRIVRVVAGAGMVAGGIATDSNLGTGVAIAGVVPLLAGAFDFCVLSPLFGGPLSGKAIRAAAK